MQGAYTLIHYLFGGATSFLIFFFFFLNPDSNYIMAPEIASLSVHWSLGFFSFTTVSTLFSNILVIRSFFYVLYDVYIGDSFHSFIHHLFNIY